MVHPYRVPPIYIEATLELCTVKKDIPYGLAVINYQDLDNQFLSFNGIGIFKEGILHQTPFICIRGDGFREQYSNMVDGRPQGNGISALFNPDEDSQLVSSPNFKEDVSGWAYYLGQTDINGRRKGFGRSHLANGSIFIGDHQNNLMNKGKLYELKSYQTFTLYKVEYNHDKDSKNGITGPSKQVPVNKEKVSEGHNNIV